MKELKELSSRNSTLESVSDLDFRTFSGMNPLQKMVVDFTCLKCDVVILEVILQNPKNNG